jgi:hypothetical protein
VSESITDEAQRIVNGDRNVAYGEPEDDLAFIGQAWAATLNSFYQVDEMHPLPAHIVALMMAQLKIIRYAHKPHRDGLVDLVGYALCAEKSVGK